LLLPTSTSARLNRVLRARRVPMPDTYRAVQQVETMLTRSPANDQTSSAAAFGPPCLKGGGHHCLSCP
jgi:hypothetical protein